MEMEMEMGIEMQQSSPSACSRDGSDTAPIRFWLQREACSHGHEHDIVSLLTVQGYLVELQVERRALVSRQETSRIIETIGAHS